MNINDFAPGNIITLDVKTPTNQGSFHATVGMIHKNYLLLEPVYHKGKLIGFPPNFLVNLSTVDNNVFHRWSNVKVRTVTFKGKPYHAVELIGDAEQVNRRNNYRVYIGTNMTIVYFTESGTKTITALIKDISETGFAFISKESFDIGRSVRLNMMLPGNAVMPLHAKIVRKVPTDRADETLYGCHLPERNPRLSNYIMLLQRNKQQQKNSARRL